MRIDPNHLSEFRDWMHAKMAASAPVSVDLAEVKAIIAMMKSAQWPIIADISDRAESDVIETINFDEADMLELDEFEADFYKQFLKERYGPLGTR